MQNRRIKSLWDNKNDDGRQHSEYNPYFHKTKKQFKYLQQCDKLKDKICEELNITLIRISHDKKVSKELIEEKLKKNKQIGG